MYDWLERAARRRPDTIALDAVGDRAFSYGELLEAARRVATIEAAAGLSPGAIRYLPDVGAAFAVPLHGALLLGATVVPVDERLSTEEQKLRTVRGRACRTRMSRR